MVDRSIICWNLPKNLCIQKKNKIRCTLTCCHSFDNKRLQKQLFRNRNRCKQLSSSNSNLCSKKPIVAKKVLLFSCKQENEKKLDLLFKKNKKGCKLELFGQRGNILWSKKRKLSLPKEKKYSYDGCLQEKTSSKQHEQLFFFETSDKDCWE